MNICLIIITVIAVIISIFCIKHKIEIDNETKRENTEIQNQLKELNYTKSQLKQNIERLTEQQTNIVNNINDKKFHLKELNKTLENHEELSNKAFQNYFQVLENKYKELEKEHDAEVGALKKSYENLQLQLKQDLAKNQEELDNEKKKKFLKNLISIV